MSCRKSTQPHAIKCSVHVPPCVGERTCWRTGSAMLDPETGGRTEGRAWRGGQCRTVPANTRIGFGSRRQRDPVHSRTRSELLPAWKFLAKVGIVRTADQTLSPAQERGGHISARGVAHFLKVILGHSLCFCVPLPTPPTSVHSFTSSFLRLLVPGSWVTEENGDRTTLRRGKPLWSCCLWGPGRPVRVAAFGAVDPR